MAQPPGGCAIIPDRSADHVSEQRLALRDRDDSNIALLPWGKTGDRGSFPPMMKIELDAAGLVRDRQMNDAI
jgi:hypothetical protein